MSWTREKMDEVYAQIQKKAAADPDYRKALLANPNAVIEKETGVTLPEGVKVSIAEADLSYQVNHVLPPAVDGELSEDDLDKVAGGSSAFETISGGILSATDTISNYVC